MLGLACRSAHIYYWPEPAWLITIQRCIINPRASAAASTQSVFVDVTKKGCVLLKHSALTISASMALRFVSQKFIIPIVLAYYQIIDNLLVNILFKRYKESH